MAKNKYYVVWKGRNPGIYDDWDVCKKEIIGCKGALYKGFPDLKSAETAFKMGYEAYKKSTPIEKALNLFDEIHNEFFKEKKQSVTQIREEIQKWQPPDFGP